MNAFSRSWLLTKLTFSVINKDRELLWFAALSFLFSTLFIVVMIFPTFVLGFMNDGPEERTLEFAEYVILFVTYFGLAFIATFFNVCVVYTSKVRFEGGDATFAESFRFALSRLGLILQWSLVSASVGLLLRLLENFSRGLGKPGQIIANILIGLLGLAWSIVTIFVVPGMVYEGLGPIAAIKKSTQVIKKTWGESLIRHFGLGLIQFLVILAVVLVAGVLTVGLATLLDTPGLLLGIAIGVVLILLTVLVFGVANTIFNTALYLYANNNKLAEGFDQNTMSHAFQPK